MRSPSLHFRGNSTVSSSPSPEHPSPRGGRPKPALAKQATCRDLKHSHRKSPLPVFPVKHQVSCQNLHDPVISLDASVDAEPDEPVRTIRWETPDPLTGGGPMLDGARQPMRRVQQTMRARLDRATLISSKLPFQATERKLIGKEPNANGGIVRKYSFVDHPLNMRCLNCLPRDEHLLALVDTTVHCLLALKEADIRSHAEGASISDQLQELVSMRASLNRMCEAIDRYRDAVKRSPQFGGQITGDNRMNVLREKRLEIYKMQMHIATTITNMERSHRS